MSRRGYVAGALGAAALLVAVLSVARLVLAFDDGEVVEPISADEAYAIGGPLSCDSRLQDLLETRPDDRDSVVWRPTPRSQRILDDLRR